MVNSRQTWYIIKRSDGHCDIVPQLPEANNSTDAEQSPVLENWGPFATPSEAIAKRVGLIRAGKCQPI